MKVRIIFFATIASFALSVTAMPQDGDAAKDDIKKLQGVWQVVKFVDHSLKPAPAEELADHVFEFNGDKVTQRKGKDDPGRPATFTIDPSKKPKWMNINVGKELEGIYKIDGDEVNLCFVGGMRGGKVTPRPTEFKASDNPPHSLMVLKRIKK